MATKNTVLKNRKGKPTLMPLYDRVIVRRDKPVEQKPDSMIIIPEAVQEKMNQGKVIAVGQGKLMDSGEVRTLQTKVGDHILFGKYNGFEIQFNGEDLIVMREDEIFALIQD